MALRRRLSDLAPPAFDFDAADAALRGLSPEGAAVVAALNDEQRAAVRAALAARDYALIQGFPGAGKSATLAAIVRALVDTGKSVLVTSHTHGAVDNVPSVCPASASTTASYAPAARGARRRHSRRRSVPGVRNAARSVEELRRLADTARVVGATCSPRRTTR